jgi:hypothetical protein
MISKKIIIACHGFPPNPGIGGRRWAKFAKYLALEGWEVHVISSENPHQHKSAWTKDVISSNIIQHVLPFNYPKEFIGIGIDSFMGRACYFLKSKYYKKIQKKRIYDSTFLWEQQFTDKVRELIHNHGIVNMVVTGAPFYLTYYAAKLKKDEFPKLNLITDFRDPWIGAVNYGISNLSPEKKALEMSYRQTVYNYSNYVTAPSAIMLEPMKEEYTGIDKSKFLELPHAYDAEDIADFLKKKQIQKIDRIKLIYGGALYMELEKVFSDFSKALDGIKITNIDLYKKLNIEFYSSTDHSLSYFQNHREVVFFYEPIGKDIFHKINEADACLILLAPHNNDFRTTKFFENMPFQKPYIVLGEKGFVAEYVINHNLGVWVSNENFTKDFLQTIDRIHNKRLKFNPAFEHQQFSYEVQTKHLIELF